MCVCVCVRERERERERETTLRICPVPSTLSFESEILFILWQPLAKRATIKVASEKIQHRT